MNGSSEPHFSPPDASPNTLQIESFVCGPLDTNTFLLIDAAARCAVVIDPSIESDAALQRAQQLRAEGITVQAIWNTHGHFDHIYDNARWKTAFNIEVWAHAADAFFQENLREQSLWFGLPAPETTAIDHFLRDGDRLEIGEFSCQVIALSGHSPGSVGFYFEPQKMMVSGDVLFAGSIGRTDLPAGSEPDLAASLRRLFDLPPQTLIFCGHGDSTTLQTEKRDNALACSLLKRFPL